MTSTGLQVLRVAGGVAAALSAESLRALEPATLKSFLAGRRWFGAKGQELHSAQIFDVIPFPWREPPAAMTRVEVDLGDGRLESYQLPVALWRGDPDAADAPGAVLARVESGGATSGRECGVLFDALEDATFRTRLREALAAGAAFEGSGARWSVELTGAVGTGLETDGETRLMASEQSNTSIVFAERSIFKLFRRLEHGEHPEAEIARFLSTRTQFRNTPELLGVVRFRDAGDHESTAGMLQRFVPNAADAWSHALARACDYLDRWDSTEPPNLFVDDAAELGRVTRGLHEALASDPSDPEFAPRPAGPNDVALWAAVAQREVERALALLESRGGGEAGQMGRWADGQMGKWGDGEKGRRADAPTRRGGQRPRGCPAGRAPVPR